MKIVFLSRRYLPSVGGVEKHLFGLIGQLGKRHHITVITEQHDPDLPLEQRVGRVRILRIPVSHFSESQKKWVIWKWFLDHENLLRESDVVHIHDVFFWVLPYKFTHPWVKLFITFHGWEGVYPIPLKNRIWHRLAEWLTAGNICIGDFISKWYGTRPSKVSYGAA